MGCAHCPRCRVTRSKRQGHNRLCKDNNLLLVTQDLKSTDLADLKGVKYVLISNAMIAKMADAKIREKYQNAKEMTP